MDPTPKHISQLAYVRESAPGVEPYIGSPCGVQLTRVDDRAPAKLVQILGPAARDFYVHDGCLMSPPFKTFRNYTFTVSISMESYTDRRGETKHYEIHRYYVAPSMKKERKKRRAKAK